METRELRINNKPRKHFEEGREYGIMLFEKELSLYKSRSRIYCFQYLEGYRRKKRCERKGNCLKTIKEYGIRIQM